MILRSQIDGNGQEYMTICVDCKLDSRGICNGKRVVLENNYKKNCYSIFEMQGARYKGELQKRKEETFELIEFQKWLSKHGYIEDEHACKAAREGR
ncbi:hypothetical protein [Extibacter muris]|uniref:Uncharacterized protein n=1 Tax=Extibacter muris TaxID=1796622 RepID=A0A4R4FGQ7_9FIRM|nr:hypothetical protein [Extibacter muris]MCU0079319.1 hypothetical protein [Extibacter muris]TDA21956.1 hypothetical protein E1963_09355 [Extibacter muris]